MKTLCSLLQFTSTSKCPLAELSVCVLHRNPLSQWREGLVEVETDLIVLESKFVSGFRHGQNPRRFLSNTRVGRQMGPEWMPSNIQKRTGNRFPKYARNDRRSIRGDLIRKRLFR